MTLIPEYMPLQFTENGLFIIYYCIVLMKSSRFSKYFVNLRTLFATGFVCLTYLQKVKSSLSTNNRICE